jgi:hypothetical protein
LAIEQQAKWVKSDVSAFAVIGEFRSIWFNVTTPFDVLTDWWLKYTGQR